MAATGGDALVVAGLTTPHCVSTTCRMAPIWAFEVTLVHDACAAFTANADTSWTTGADPAMTAQMQSIMQRSAHLHGEFVTARARNICAHDQRRCLPGVEPLPWASAGSVRCLERDRQAEALWQATGLPPAVCAVLARAEVAPDAAQDYLAPSLRALLPDPRSLKDMEVAAARACRPHRGRERIAIFADYDVDGGLLRRAAPGLAGPMGARPRFTCPTG